MFGYQGKRKGAALGIGKRKEIGFFLLRLSQRPEQMEIRVSLVEIRRISGFTDFHGGDQSL